jgi:hypothetical protein
MQNVTRWRMDMETYAIRSMREYACRAETEPRKRRMPALSHNQTGTRGIPRGQARKMVNGLDYWLIALDNADGFGKVMAVC